MGDRATRWLEKAALGRPETRAWALYDWANSAFWLTVITTVFPIYFLKLSEGELSPDDAQLRYAAASRNALIVIAILAPFLGTMADVRAAKKRFLGFFAYLGVLSVAVMFFLYPGDWRLALVLFGVANIGAAGSVVFYDALLPHVARKGEMDRLSTSGFALGYVGSGLLLVLNLLWLRKPEWFGLPHGEGLSVEEATLPTRLCFLSVAIWWGLFTLPILRRVKEPPAAAPMESEGSTFGASLRRLRGTFRELRQFRQAFKMLIAFLIYNDGVVTLIRMAAIYAAARSLDQAVILLSILVLQFVGVPFSLLFGSLGARFGARRMVLIGIVVYSFISILAYGMETNWHFVVLALLVGTVQGGTQGLSRSLFASMIPSHKSGEFFSFFAVGEKFAGVLGPALFVWMITLTGSSQNAILSIIAFFVIGGLLLTRVDVEEGRRAAREAEAAAGV